MLAIIDIRCFYYIIKANAQAFVTSQDVVFRAKAKKNLLVINEIVAIMLVIIGLRQFYYIIFCTTYQHKAACDKSHGQNSAFVLQ